MHAVFCVLFDLLSIKYQIIMKHTFQVFLGVTLILLTLTHCKEPTQRIARSVGATSEMLVVTQTEDQWNGLAGEAIRNYFGQEQYGLPQPEALFRIANINVSNLSDMFRKHRNILVVEIDPKLKEAVVETRTDLWSKPQRVVKITAENQQQWVEAFNKQKEGIRLLYDKSERERLMNIYRPTADYKVIDEVGKTLGFKLMIPEGFFVAKNEGNFMWIRKEVADYSQGLILYTLPYSDTADLNDHRTIHLRDSLLQKHIPGPSTGSYMSTDKEFIKPEIKRIGHYVTDFAVENRGVWNVVGDFMAGPYLAYTIVDQKRGRLITVEGYVYAPNKDKRDYLRQMEAILYSLEMVDNQSK